MDDLLPQVGEFGKYQKLMLWCICLPACIPCGFCAFNQLFMAGVPDHWCYIPQLANLTTEQRRRIGVPSDNFTVDHCQRFAINWTEVLGYLDYDIEDFQPDTTWPLEPCYDGWEYNKTEIFSSIVIDVSNIQICIMNCFYSFLFLV